jgi:hypothetical protein
MNARRDVNATVHELFQHDHHPFGNESVRSMIKKRDMATTNRDATLISIVLSLNFPACRAYDQLPNAQTMRRFKHNSTSHQAKSHAGKRKRFLFRSPSFLCLSSSFCSLLLVRCCCRGKQRYIHRVFLMFILRISMIQHEHLVCAPVFSWLDASFTGNQWFYMSKFETIRLCWFRLLAAFLIRKFSASNLSNRSCHRGCSEIVVLVMNLKRGIACPLMLHSYSRGLLRANVHWFCRQL